MNLETDLSAAIIVRLNAGLFPVRDGEAALYERYGIKAIQVEANRPEEIMAYTAGCDAVLVVSAALPTQVVENLEKCQIISRLGVGTDKIDVETATRKGILVSNVPDFCVPEQADHTMALLLALVRQLPQMAQDMQAGNWTKARANPRLMRLAGRTMGLVGFGRSAVAVAKRARAFDMQVLATRRNLEAPSREAEELGVEIVDFDTVLAESDIVSLHLPLVSETYHLFNEDTLRKMKPGALLINTARGAIVDEAALVEAIRDGRLGGAGIDTFAEIDVHSEIEQPPQHPLLELDNVILTPHVAAISPDAMFDVAKGGIENVVAVLRGHWPPDENIVNPGVKPRKYLKTYETSVVDW